MRWSEEFHKFLVGMEGRVDALSGALRRVDRPVVIPYRGFAGNGRIWVRGRVIDDPRIAPAALETSVAGNVRDVWLRFATHEIAGARVELTVGSSTTELITGPEGYFEAELNLPARSKPGWLPYSVSLTEPVDTDDEWEGHLLVPPSDARVGIISDIDDTVLESSATSRLRMLRTLLTGNARTRLPFEGIARLLRELSEGGAPVFYVSSGPWNLYGFLEEFFAINGLPPGPILLQDYGIDEKKMIHSDHHDHKLEQIGLVMKTYPDLEWILIGDSGQRDPEIYAAVALELPERVRAIVIRDVTTARRDAQVREIVGKIGDRPRVALVQTAQEARAFLLSEGLLPLRESAS